MRTRVIGDTTVTAVGLGDVRLATATARGLDARDVERSVHDALELGITFVDVCEEADAERLCGDALRTLRLRDTVVLATRVPALAEPLDRVRDPLRERLPPRHVQDRVEASLRATKLDALPLALLAHHPAWRDSPAWPELAGACARLVREGKVLRWGADWIGRDALAASTPPPAPAPVEPPPATPAGLVIATSLPSDPAALLALVAGGAGATAPPPVVASQPTASLGPGAPFVALATAWSACTRDDGPAPARDGAVVLARSPLAGGALAGTFGPGVKLAPRDDRRSLDDTALERIAIGCAKLALLVRHEPPAARSCDAARAALERGRRPDHVEAATLAELALRYALDRGALALPRLHHRDHVVDAIAAAAAPALSPELLDRIADALHA